MNFAFIRERFRSLSSLAPRRDSRFSLGRRGERAAGRYLRRHRHRILARNYRCVAGEIDLISVHGDTLVFVEVKTRSSRLAQEPHEALRPVQRRRIENAARCFLMQHSAQDRPCRFDVVTVVWERDGHPRIEHFENAFPPRRL